MESELLLGDFAKNSAHHWCEAFGFCVPKGYGVSGFINFGSFPVGSYVFNRHNGQLYKVEDRELIGCGPFFYKIEEKIEWVTPTDEDARHRPTVYLQSVSGHWLDRPYTLLYVVLDEGEPMYGVGVSEKDSGDTITTERRLCRMDAKLREDWK